MGASMMDALTARKYFTYSPENGELRWAIRSSPAAAVGDLITSRTVRGNYLKVQFNGKYYTAHRIIWLMVYGEWPRDQIDHVNGDGGDNRLCNLREATHSQNQQNRRAMPNSSGFPGARFDKLAGHYRVSVMVNGIIHNIGAFKDPEFASLVYSEAKRKYHKFAPVLRSA